MKRPIIFLTLLLAVQLGLVFTMYYGNSQQAEISNQRPLLNFDTAGIDGIELRGSDQAKLVLKKKGGSWILPDYFGATAAADKVENLLTTLAGLTRPWPVAKSTEAGKRFKVDEQNFERQLVFSSKGKTEETLLLGSSPGFRRVHARISGEPEIYDIPFSTIQVNLKGEDWLDLKQLQVKADEISTVELPDCRLIRRDGAVELDQLGENEQTDAKQAQRLLEQLADLQIRDIFGKADKTLPNPIELRIKLSLKDGSSREYGFAKGDKPGYEVLQVADAPNLFKINNGMIRALQEFNRSKLAQAKPTATPAEAEGEKRS